MWRSVQREKGDLGRFGSRISDRLRPIATLKETLHEDLILAALLALTAVSGIAVTSQSAFAGAQAGAAAALTPAGAANLRNQTARPQVLDLRARVSYRDELLADSSRCADAGASLAHRSIARVA